jgi:hypothetical protein
MNLVPNGAKPIPYRAVARQAWLSIDQLLLVAIIARIRTGSS